MEVICYSGRYEQKHICKVLVHVWAIVEEGYQYPASIPTDAAERKKYEINAKAMNVLLGSMSESEFAKVMQLHSAKEYGTKSF